MNRIFPEHLLDREAEYEVRIRNIEIENDDQWSIKEQVGRRLELDRIANIQPLDWKAIAKTEHERHEEIQNSLEVSYELWDRLLAPNTDPFQFRVANSRVIHHIDRLKRIDSGILSEQLKDTKNEALHNLGCVQNAISRESSKWCSQPSMYEASVEVFDTEKSEERAIYSAWVELQIQAIESYLSNLQVENPISREELEQKTQELKAQEKTLLDTHKRSSCRWQAQPNETCERIQSALAWLRSMSPKESCDFTEPAPTAPITSESELSRLGEVIQQTQWRQQLNETIAMHIELQKQSVITQIHTDTEQMSQCAYTLKVNTVNEQNQNGDLYTNCREVIVQIDTENKNQNEQSENSDNHRKSEGCMNERTRVHVIEQVNKCPQVRPVERPPPKPPEASIKALEEPIHEATIQFKPKHAIPIGEPTTELEKLNILEFRKPEHTKQYGQLIRTKRYKQIRRERPVAPKKLAQNKGRLGSALRVCREANDARTNQPWNFEEQKCS